MARKMRQSGVDWIGEIPEGWEMKPLKRLVSCNDNTLEEDSPADFEFDYIDVGAVKYGKGIVSRERMRFGDAPSRARRMVRQGDVIVSTVRTYLKSVARIPESDVQLVASTGFAALRSKDVNADFLQYMLLAESFVSEVESKSKGISYPAINASDLLRIKVPVPALEKQVAIARSLGASCGEIDLAIKENKALIDDYKSLKTAFSFEAVTGKNLKGKKVSSGQDWLGEIPAAWDVRRIVNLYREVSERGDDSLPILSVSINTGVSDKELSDEEQERVFIRSEDKTKYKRVQPGDLTYNMMRAWQGAFGAVRVNGMVSPAYVVARPKVEMDSRYVEYLLRSPNATREMQRYSRGIADFRLRLYWPEFKNIRIPCPPLEEQKRIADMLDEKCGEIDAVIADKERLIADLETYKKSLIFEVVTGKREVA